VVFAEVVTVEAGVVGQLNEVEVVGVDLTGGALFIFNLVEDSIGQGRLGR
jgi:hypothetical protein